jgi:hypothetical protein
LRQPVETTITATLSLLPIEYIPVRGYPLTRSGRVLLLGWGLFLVAGFALAAWVEPDPRGYGTHQRLGLPPCSFHVLFGTSCPSCGSTTSFAHFVRGHWPAAVRCNTAAFLLALTCAAMIPWSWYSAWRGRLWQVEQPATAFLWLLIVLCSISIAQWIMRLLWSW